MKVMCTAFHKIHMFFGRTYTSDPFELKATGPTLYNAIMNDYVYLGTPLESESLQLGLEFVAYEINENKIPIKSTMRSIGWTILSVPKGKSSQYAPIYKGTPRLLYVDGLKQEETRTTRFEFQCSEISMPADLHKIIPINCICGPADFFPGFYEFHLPKTSLSFLETGMKDKSDLQILPTTCVYVNNCIMQIPETLESKLLEDFKKGLNTSEVHIHERRLNVGTHNQWKYVNKAKNKNSIALSLDKQYLQCNGILLVDNVYLCDEMALVFELEYALRIIQKGKNEEIRYVSLGELIVPLPFIKVTSVIEKVDVVDELCSEITNRVNDHPVWCMSEDMIQKQESKITIHCEIASSQGLVADSNTREKLKILEEKKRLDELRKKKLKEMQELEEQKEAEFRQQQISLEAKEKELLQKEEEQMKLLNENKEAKNEEIKAEQKVEVLEHVEQPEENKNPISFRQEIEKIEDKYSKEKMAAAIMEEKTNQLKASTIFLTFNSFIPTVRRVDLETVPKRLCFALKFFNFPLSKTPSANLKPGTWQLELNKNVGTWTNVFSRDENGTLIKLQYDFDPSLDPEISVESQIEEFSKYLYEHKLKITVFDADSLFILGYGIIELNEIMRKNNPNAMLIDKEIPIISSLRETVGRLVFTMQNYGRLIGEIKYDPLKSTTQFKNDNPGATKGKTKVRSKPITKTDLAILPEKVKGMSTSQMVSEDELRKNQMVLNYRLQQKINPLNQIDDNVLKYRDVSRTLTFSHMWDKSMRAQSTSIIYLLGQLVIYPVTFVNPENKECSFSIEINDPDGTNPNEIKVVKNPDEWRFYCVKENLQTPSDWNKFSSMGNLMLKPKEQICLIFTILAFDKPVKQVRTFRISIRNINDNLVIYRKDTVLQYRDAYYNNIIMISAPENKPIDIPLQTELPPELIPLANNITCNNPNVETKIHDGRIIANYLVKNSVNDTELLFYIFADNYFYNTLSIIQVIVKSYKCIDALQVTGYFSTYNLEFITPTGKQLEIFSSDKSLAQIDPKISGGVVILKGGEQVKIPVKIGSLKVGKYEAFIHCIDFRTKEITNRWMIRIESKAPNIILEYNITVPLKETVQTSFEYQNTSLSEKKIDFDTSHPEIFKILQRDFKIAPGAKTVVPVMLKAMEEPMQAKILIFAFEKETTKHEAFLFTISYVK